MLTNTSSIRTSNVFLWSSLAAWVEESPDLDVVALELTKGSASLQFSSAISPLSYDFLCIRGYFLVAFLV